VHVPPRPMVAVRQEVDFPRIKPTKSEKPRKSVTRETRPADPLSPLPIPQAPPSYEALAAKILQAHPAVEKVLSGAVARRLARKETAEPKTPPDWSKILDRLYYHGLFSRVTRTAPPPPPAPEVKERLSLAIAHIDTSRLSSLLARRKALDSPQDERGPAQRAAANLRMLIEGSTLT